MENDKHLIATKVSVFNALLSLIYPVIYFNDVIDGYYLLYLPETDQ